MKNLAPDKFVEEAVEFSKQMEEQNYEDKFKKIKTENRIRGRLGNRMIIFKGDSKKSSEVFEILVDEWYNKFLSKLDKLILKTVSEAVKKTSTKRTEIIETVYNFTGQEISEEILGGLKVGANFVLHKSRSRNEASKKLNEEILEYLKKYRSVIEKQSDLEEDNLVNWLEDAVQKTKIRRYYAS